MNKSKLKKIIQEEILKLISENQPLTYPNQPGTKEKEETDTKPKPKRRTLAPPSESPNTKPKALMKEEEKELVDKIAQRFKKLNHNPHLTEIKINTPTNLGNKLTYDQIQNLPELDLKIGKYDISKGRKGTQVPFNSIHVSNETRNRSLKVFNKLGIKPEKAWVAWLMDDDNYPYSGKSTFILSHYNEEPILVDQTQTESPMAGQIYLYSKYFKSGKALRLPDGESRNLDTSGLFADDNATKEQILQALKIPQ